MAEDITESRNAEEIDWAKDYANKFGYDQIVVIGRRHSGPTKDQGEWVTTYGRTPQDSNIAKLIGNFLKHRVMGWKRHGSIQGTG